MGGAPNTTTDGIDTTLTDKDMKTFADLCCGIGGFRLALEREGLECTFSCDIDERARTAYEANFGDRPHGDLMDIESDAIPDHDVLCAGFPCQPFSKAGTEKGLKEDSVIFKIADVAKVKQPKAMILENVPNILSTNGGRDIIRIIDALKDAGYKVVSSVLNSGLYGIPQQRRRIYFVCLHNDSGLQFEWPRPNQRQCSLNDILQSDEERKRRKTQRKHFNTQWLGKTRNNEWFSLDSNETKLLGWYVPRTQGKLIYDPSGHAVTQTYGKTGLYLINGSVRHLTRVEMTRVMGFPDSHKSLTKYLLGNAVIPEMVRLVYNGISHSA